MTEKFDPGFAFNIGDALILKAARLLGDHSRDTVVWIVAERIWQECPGGVQRQYKVRGVSTTGTLHEWNGLLLEHELEPFDPELLNGVGWAGLRSLRATVQRLEGELAKAKGEDEKAEAGEDQP